MYLKWIIESFEALYIAKYEYFLALNTLRVTQLNWGFYLCKISKVFIFSCSVRVRDARVSWGKSYTYKLWDIQIFTKSTKSWIKHIFCVCMCSSLLYFPKLEQFSFIFPIVLSLFPHFHALFIEFVHSLWKMCMCLHGNVWNASQ